MKINILTDPESWLVPYLPQFAEELAKFGAVNVVGRQNDLVAADVSFFLSCFEIVKGENLNKSRLNLAVHESDLPRGRGWSPVTWQVLEGKNRIPVVLFEASAGVDQGKIFLKTEIVLEGHELIAEIREKQAKATFSLCLQLMRDLSNLKSAAAEQDGTPTYYPRRTPKDSELDPQKTIAEQFDLLRVVDNERYPAFFTWRGHRYLVKIEKEGPRE